MGIEDSIPLRLVVALALAGLAVSAIAVGIPLDHLLGNALGSSGPVDLRVYMHGAAAIRADTTLYGSGFSVASPAGLPFTYPPFAAIALVPLSFVGLGLLAWLWEIVSVIALGGCVTVAFRPLLARSEAMLGRRFGRTLALVVITSLALLARPVYDDLSFGQVDMVLMVACMFACVSQRSRPGRAVLVGLAAAIKVVPGIFIVYLVLTRRWRMAGAALAAWAAATGLGFALRPAASVTYYGRLLWEPGRPGTPTSFLNQSVWGMVERLDLGPWKFPAIALAVSSLGVIGLARAVRAWRGGDPVAGVVLVGLVAVLASPISWIHETVWLIPAVGLLVGDGRFRQPYRLILGATVMVLMVASLPYVGNALDPSHWFAQVLMDTYGLTAAGLILVGLRSSADVSWPRRRHSAGAVPRPDRKAAIGERAEGVRRVATLDKAPAAL